MILHKTISTFPCSRTILSTSSPVHNKLYKPVSPDGSLVLRALWVVVCPVPTVLLFTVSRMSNGPGWAGRAWCQSSAATRRHDAPRAAAGRAQPRRRAVLRPLLAQPLRHGGALRGPGELSLVAVTWTLDTDL